ncbi:MAG: hypothetical protein IJG02_00570 [Thermoguttaceae bacterium]|nr:hypothetical protein [Thermoguttaceae bacterium]
MNRYRITFLAAALLLFAALPARGAERQAQSADGSIEAVCSLPGDGAGIADTIDMTITVRQSLSDDQEAAAVTFPEFGPKYGDFDVERTDSAPQIIAARAAQQGCVVTLAPTRVGTAVLPPIPIVLTRGGASETILIPAGTFPITSIHDPAGASLDALAPPRPLRGPFPWRRVLGLALVAALLAAALRAYLVHRRGAPAGSAQVPPRLSASQKALRALDVLVGSNLAKRNIAEFYLHLTRIVRAYIEETTELKAIEQTTEEFLQAARSRPEALGVHQRSALGEFLEFADLVKFARFRPTDEQIDDGLRKARRFVTEENNTPEDTGSPKDTDTPGAAVGRDAKRLTE